VSAYILRSVDPDDGIEGDEPLLPWVPPDDRLWRHPSELPTDRTGSLALAARDSDRRLWAVALLAGVVGAVLASGAGVVTGGYRRTTTVVRPIEQVAYPTGPVVTPVSNPPTQSIVAIAQRLAPTIVELVVTGNGTDLAGSGVIFTSDGYLLTNSHIVAAGGTITAIMHDGRRVNCRLVGSDPATDIAVVKLPQHTTLSAALLGSSTGLKVGEPALTVGFPGGVSHSPSVTSGIISALGRNVPAGAGPSLVDMIQTDAWVSPTSSGGALVDAQGMVVGITTAATAGNPGAPGQGFATPIDVARDVADQLLTSGKVVHVWLGVTGVDTDSATAEELGIPGGAVIQDVDDDSPAAKAGMQATDIVTGLGGGTIASMGALEVAVRHHRPGQQVTIRFLRDGHPRDATVVLAERPAVTSP